MTMKDFLTLASNKTNQPKENIEACMEIVLEEMDEQTAFKAYANTCGFGDDYRRELSA